MSSRLVEFLYPLPELSRSPLALLGWWESRRPAFNLIVGGTGVVTLGAVNLLAWLPPHPVGLPLLQVLPLIVIYGVLANVCYSGGFLAELMLRRVLGPGAPRPGPALLRMGLTFSVGLTLFPIGLASIDWLIRVVRFWIW
jgi:hypothetical protein